MKLPFASRLGAFGRARPLSRDKADTLLLLISCTLVLLPHAGHVPLWVTASCAALLGWRGWLTLHGNPMPPRWVLLPIAVALMASVYLNYRTLFGREPGVTMLTLLLALKLLEMHAKRDLFVALFLSFFLILSSFFYSQSIGTALLTVATVVMILTTQISFQYTGSYPPLKQRLRLGASVLLLAAPVTLVLFLLFPRIQGPLWGLPADAHSGRTGLSDTMEPGRISNLARSEDIAFRVRFDGTPPAQPQLYWRGVVLGAYDGRTWSPLHGRRQFTPPLAVNFRGEAVNYQVTLEPHGRRWLFVLDVPRAVPELEGNPAIVSPDLQMLSAMPISERVRYDAASHLDYDLQPAIPPAALQEWLQLPPGYNPRTLAYAADLLRQSDGKLAFVNRVLRGFREENFRYTLSPPLLGRNAIDDFLFSTRSGFCEHYSAAFVVLMRAAGIPARVVTGYQGGEINPADGFLSVRQSDAHAWAEIWLDKRGWVRIDPTAAVAPDRVERNLASVVPRQILGGLITLDDAQHPLLSRLHQLRQSWDAVTNAWNQWVLNYTPQQQRSFIRSLGFEDIDWPLIIALMFALVVVAVGIVIVPLLLHERKREPVDILYAKLCRALERRGFPRQPHEGPRSYAARLTAPASPLPQQQKAALARFLELYETVRYGAQAPATASAVARLKSLLAECR